MVHRAVVLMNLGGPDSPAAVRPFLYNLFGDPAIIGLPRWLRLPLARMIARLRGPRVRANYRAIGGGSPILERTREIGIMKAIGGSDGDIGRIFLVEASVIGLLGGLLGILLGWAAGRVINFGANIYIERQGGLAGNLFTIPWWLIAGGIVFSIVVSLAAGLYPASRAARRARSRERSRTSTPTTRRAPR